MTPIQMVFCGLTLWEIMQTNITGPLSRTLTLPVMGSTMFQAMMRPLILKPVQAISSKWDAWPATDQDYDLDLYDGNYNLVASSESIQTGTQPPTEFIFYSAPTTDTYHLAIYKYKATSNHRFAIFSLEHRLHPAIASQSITSPADAAGVMAVGAISRVNWTTGPLESFW